MYLKLGTQRREIHCWIPLCWEARLGKNVKRHWVCERHRRSRVPYVTLARSLDLRSSPRIFEHKRDCSLSIQMLTAGRLQEGSTARECGCLIAQNVAQVIWAQRKYRHLRNCLKMSGFLTSRKLLYKQTKFYRSIFVNVLALYQNAFRQRRQ